MSYKPDDVAKYVDRMIVMNDGKIVLDGEPRKCLEISGGNLKKPGFRAKGEINITQTQIGAGIEQECITPKEAQPVLINIRKGNKWTETYHWTNIIMIQ